MLVDDGEWITLLEPVMPAEGDSSAPGVRRLEDLSVELAEKASALDSQVKSKARQSMSTLLSPPQ